VVVCGLVIGTGRSTLGQAEEPIRLDAGALQLEIFFSRTAHLFHVVDQLAEWSEFSHRQYGRYFDQLDGGYSARDRELLAKHTAIRAVHGWGNGLEQTFYASAGLESALQLGVQQGYLTQEQANTEREILTHFAPRIDRLRERELPTLEAFAQRLRAQLSDLRRFSEKASRFVRGERVTVQAYLIANPDERRFGGGYEAGRLTLEIPRAYDAYPVFLHEVLHAFINNRRAEVEKAAQGVPGLDFMTLNEGIAYALSPGILHPDSATYPLAGDRYAWTRDPLLDKVRADIQAQKPLTDPYTRFNRFGLALRPLLKDAFESDTATITSFLPRAIDAWRVLVELDAALRTRSEEEKK